MANGAWGQLGLEEVVVRVGLDVWHSNAVYHTMDLGTVANNVLSCSVEEKDSCLRTFVALLVDGSGRTERGLKTSD